MLSQLLMARTITSSPAAQVFGTVELVGLIVSHLKLRDLLAAQRVSFLFHEVIKRSPRTQKTLYLLPDKCLENGSKGMFVSNPLYLQRFVQQACLYALEQLNPKVHFIGMDKFVKARQKSFAEPAAKWSQMLLFQPPVKLALLKSISAHYGDEYHTLHNADGLRMGDVVDFFQKKSDGGMNNVELLSATVTRKVVWMVMPEIMTVDAYDLVTL
jgi:hypothetical protein